MRGLFPLVFHVLDALLFKVNAFFLSFFWCFVTFYKSINLFTLILNFYNNFSSYYTRLLFSLSVSCFRRVTF